MNNDSMNYSRLMKCIISGCFLISIATLTVLSDAKELVLHLPLDGLNGDTTEDISKFGNDATLEGEPKLIQGAFGMGLEFDGKSFGEIPDHASLDIVDGVTIEFWTIVRPGEAVQTGVEKGPTWGEGLYTLAARYNNGTILQFFDLPDNCDDENIGPRIQEDGNWHFLAGTWDGQTIRLYINGELKAEMECEGKLKPNNGPLFIGGRGGTVRFLTGALDEIKIYNYALTEEELLRDMEAPVTLNVNMRNKLTTTWAHLKTERVNR